MRSSKLARNIVTYLPVLAVLAAMVMGVALGMDLYPPSLDSQPEIGLIVPGTMQPCSLSAIYTSLPPKCKTSDGKFIPLPGASPYILLTPAGK